MASMDTNSPHGVAVDGAGNVYVDDFGTIDSQDQLSPLTTIDAGGDQSCCGARIRCGHAVPRLIAADSLALRQPVVPRCFPGLLMLRFSARCTPAGPQPDTSDRPG